jgi:hypothetical protein
MSKVDEAIVEIEKALDDLELPLEGLRDFERLNLDTETMTRVREARVQYTTRQNKLNQALNFLNELVNDGYPTLDIPEVSLSVQKDLEAQQASIAAALAKFKTDAAVNLGLTGSQPESK